MKIELKNVKYAAFASQETSCFSATVYIDGKKAGEVENGGYGGCDNFHPHELQQRLDAYGATLPKTIDYLDGLSNRDDGGYEMAQDAESLIGDLLQDYLVTRDLKRILSTKLLFIKGNKLMQTGRATKDKLARWLAPDQRQRSAEMLGTTPTDILNLMPFDQALATYKKLG